MRRSRKGSSPGRGFSHIAHCCALRSLEKVHALHCQFPGGHVVEEPPAPAADVAEPQSERAETEDAPLLGREWAGIEDDEDDEDEYDDEEDDDEDDDDPDDDRDVTLTVVVIPVDGE